MVETAFQLGENGNIIEPFVHDQSLTGLALDQDDCLTLTLRLVGGDGALLIPKVGIVSADWFTCSNIIFDIIFGDLTQPGALDRLKSETWGSFSLETRAILDPHVENHSRFLAVTSSYGGPVVALGSWDLDDVKLLA